MFNFVANQSIDKIDHEMRTPMEWRNGEKIVGVLSRHYLAVDKTEEEELREQRECEDYENLIAGILNDDVNLVKLAFAHGNIAKGEFTKIVVEKADGSRTMTYFFPEFEAAERGCKEIVDYMQECFAKQPVREPIFQPAKVPKGIVVDKKDVDRVDYEMSPIDWRGGGKIVGLIKAPAPFFEQSKEEKLKEENKYRDFQKLIEGILTNNIDLVKLALEPRNITDMDSVRVAVEKGGVKEMGFFFPINEARAIGNKEIISYMEKVFGI